MRDHVRGKTLHFGGQVGAALLDFVQAVQQHQGLTLRQSQVEQGGQAAQFGREAGKIDWQKGLQAEVGVFEQGIGKGVQRGQDGQGGLGILGQTEGQVFEQRALAGAGVAQHHHPGEIAYRFFNRQGRRF